MSVVHLIQPLDNLTDEELMARLAAGDEAALTPLHARYAGIVFGMAAQTLDRSAAEEITQEVFLTIWQKADTFDPDRGRVRSWLLRIAHLRILNELRRRGHRPRIVPDPEETQLGAVVDGAPLPDDEAWRNYRRAAIVAAVEVAWPKPVVLTTPVTQEPSRWRFAGRWWSKPIPVRRDRPW